MLPMKVGLFYGSSTCYTEMAAEKIKDVFAPSIEVVLHNVADASLVHANDFDVLILGIPTWDYGEIQEDWDEVWPGLFEVAFNTKLVALYGLGDQEGYPEWFLDAMGILHDKIIELGATVIGHYPAEDFHFEKSKALIPVVADSQASMFVGLALDYENEFDAVDQRIEQWCTSITPTLLAFFEGLNE